MKTFTKAALFAASLTTLALIGRSEQRNRASLQHETPTHTEVINDGNGVFYFPYPGVQFGTEFSAWRANHKGWIIIAIAPTTNEYNLPSGYYVIANPDQ